MSELKPTESLRQLRSPFNGELWTVPPDVSKEMYAALLERGFVPVEDAQKPSKERRGSR
jgi:hypothetical protein